MTAIPSTSTFHTGLLRPPTISVLASDARPAQHRRTASAHFGNISWVVHDRGDLHQILDLHTGGA